MITTTPHRQILFNSTTVPPFLQLLIQLKDQGKVFVRSFVVVIAYFSCFKYGSFTAINCQQHTDSFWCLIHCNIYE